MTLEEAIEHAEEVARAAKKDADYVKLLGEKPDAWGRTVESCIKCADDHLQLARWLKELQKYRELFSSHEEAAEVVNMNMV